MSSISLILKVYVNSVSKQNISFPLSLSFERLHTSYTLSFGKNMFYKNIEAEI